MSVVVRYWVVTNALLDTHCGATKNPAVTPVLRFYESVTLDSPPLPDQPAGRQRQGHAYRPAQVQGAQLLTPIARRAGVRVDADGDPVRQVHGCPDAPVA